MSGWKQKDECRNLVIPSEFDYDDQLWVEEDISPRYFLKDDSDNGYIEMNFQEQSKLVMIDQEGLRKLKEIEKTYDPQYSWDHPLNELDKKHFLELEFCDVFNALHSFLDSVPKESPTLANVGNWSYAEQRALNESYCLIASSVLRGLDYSERKAHGAYDPSDPEEFDNE